MSTLEIVKYGFVWCPGCGETRQRSCELEPLPRCGCGEWMEVLLCEAVGCEAEASVETDRGHFCSEHVG